MCHRKWFFRKPDDEKLKRNEEGDVDLYSEPSLCLSLLSFFPCIIGLAEEPYFITSHLARLYPLARQNEIGRVGFSHI
jgi:hypothetical protein